MKKRKTRAQRSRSFRCPHCGAAMILRPASEIYHDAKSDRKLYVCHNYPACNTYVAAHPNTDKPMGVPANGDLRNLRIQAHRKFDLIWKNGIMTREEAYRWFADSFGLKAYTSVNGNVPYFSAAELTTQSFETYSDLDSLGRCGVTYACIGKDLMPTEERGSIGMVKPTGWHTVRYDDLVDGKYLYNRCHLIGYQLTGENANTKNLITGTRYLNIEGMLPFENMVADYIQETNNHVLYRVTPIFEGNNLLATGVLMEGYSVEDKGAGVSYCVFAYNVQPGIEIDYATGESKLADGAQQEEQKTATVTPTPSPELEKQEPVTGSEALQADYILNTNTKKFHHPTCSSVNDMKEKNKQEFFGTRDETIALGYSPCGRCKP